MLTLTFLGVGSAFAKRNFQSNALVEAWRVDPQHQTRPDDVLLIDFGTTGPLGLYRLKNTSGFSYLDRDGAIDYAAVRNIFITHLHGDHVGGLEELAILNRYQQPQTGGELPGKPRLFGEPSLLDHLWAHTLSGGIGASMGRIASLGDYFDVLPLKRVEDRRLESFALLDRYDVLPFQTDHVRVWEPLDWPSYGLLLRDRASGGTVVYSGDTRFEAEFFEPMLADARLNFHEVQLVDEPGSIHATLSQLRTLDSGIRKRMILYHYGDSWDDECYSFVTEAFFGFAQPCQRYVLFS